VKLPRDISGEDLAKALERFGYGRERQRGSHLQMVTHVGGEHHVTVPMHSPIKAGTLNSVLRSVGEHRKLGREELLGQLFK
jgi:predicted RNA binding protein YcfA (HicA-like mRNA interferase family)